MAETNLEQLWAEEAEQETAARMERMEDLAEVNDDSEEYIEDEEKTETRHLGAIGSSKPRSESPEEEEEPEVRYWPLIG